MIGWSPRNKWRIDRAGIRVWKSRSYETSEGRYLSLVLGQIIYRDINIPRSLKFTHAIITIKIFIEHVLPYCCFNVQFIYWKVRWS